MRKPLSIHEGAVRRIVGSQRDEPDGSPALDHYELEFYWSARAAFPDSRSGKARPRCDRKILVDFTALLVPFPHPRIVYNAAVAAVGPIGGAAVRSR